MESHPVCPSVSVSLTEDRVLRSIFVVANVSASLFFMVK